MLIYENITKCMIDALCSVEYENECEDDLIKRLYINNVEIDFIKYFDKKKIHLCYIESKIKHKNMGTKVLKDFVSEFNDYDIYLEAVPWLVDWYKSFGFTTEYFIPEMCCYRMKLKAEGS